MLLAQRQEVEALCSALMVVLVLQELAYVCTGGVIAGSWMHLSRGLGHRV